MPYEEEWFNNYMGSKYDSIREAYRRENVGRLYALQSDLDAAMRGALAVANAMKDAKYKK
jgi:hypothetical protein